MINIVEIIVTLIICVIIVVCVVSFIRRIKQKRMGLRISDTPTVVVAIQKIAELVTFCFFEEKVLMEKKTTDCVNNKVCNLIANLAHKEEGLLTDEICVIAKGQVRAGYNLKKITNNDISINGSVLTIKLPNVEILDVIINPKGWDFYVEDGKWSEEEVKAIQGKAKDAITQDAIQFGILNCAEKNGKDKIKALLMSLGFSNVIINY